LHLQQFLRRTTAIENNRHLIKASYLLFFKKENGNVALGSHENYCFEIIFFDTAKWQSLMCLFTSIPLFETGKDRF
jgi:hypothetical protein